MENGALSFTSESHVLVLDLGSQYTRLIATTLRKQRILAVLAPGSMPAPAKAPVGLRGIILSGGPGSAHDSPAFDLGWLTVRHANNAALTIPVLGICLGMQLMAEHYGGQVVSSSQREYGLSALRWLSGSERITAGVPTSAPVGAWMSHGDSVSAVPAGWRTLASTPTCPIAAMASPDWSRVGLQFHPEVKHTDHGARLLASWAVDVCGLLMGWTASHVLPTILDSIRTQVGEGHVLCAVSGGVDSSVTAALAIRALGVDHVHCVFIDNGLLREGEREECIRLLERCNPLVVDASEVFLDRLAGVEDPERKRRIIGKTFIDILQEEARRLDDWVGDVRWLAQGTLYSDVVESMSASGEVIKTHHNVGGLPASLGMQLLEPLRLMFKDEVRELGRQLAMPEELLTRQPFPGPGLAIRVLGAVTAERVGIVRAADAIVRKMAPRCDTRGRAIWQTFAVLLPVKAVGVMGDKRTYDNVCVIRSVCSDDAMTASLPAVSLGAWSAIASQIVREVPHINRVTFDLTSKPPGTIEWE